MSWWVTKIEVAKDGTRAVFHRNGGPYGETRDTSKVSKMWTHPDTDTARAACDVCERP